MKSLYIFNIKDFHNGKNEAFKYIYDRWFVQLCWVAEKLGMSPEDREDIVTDKIMYLYEHRLQYNSLDEISKIVFASVKYGSISNLQRKKRRTKSHFELIWYLNDWSLFTDSMEHKDLVQHLIKIIPDIPAKLKEILYLIYYKGYTCTEVAAIIGRSHPYVIKIHAITLKYIKSLLIGTNITLESLLPKRKQTNLNLAGKIMDLKNKGMSQHEIARELLITRSRVQKIVCGSTKLKYTQLV